MILLYVVQLLHKQNIPSDVWKERNFPFPPFDLFLEEIKEEKWAN